MTPRLSTGQGALLARFLALFLFMLMLILILRAPATLISRLVEYASGNAVQFIASRGSVWSGTASLRLTGDAEPLPIQWTSDAADVLQAAWIWRLTLDGQEVRLRLRPSGWSLDSAQLKLPLRRLRIFLPALVATYHWDGLLRLDAQAFGQAWGGDAWRGQAQLDVDALAVRELSASVLGSYRAELEAQGDNLAIRLLTREGPLRVQGSGRLNQGCEATATLDAGAAPEMPKILDMLGEPIPQAKGHTQWRLSCVSRM